MRIAVIQMNSEPDVDANLRTIRRYIAASAKNGADLVVFPEAAMFPFDSGRLDMVAQPLDGPFARAVRRSAEENDVTAVVGMFTPADTVYRQPAGDLKEDPVEGSGEANRFRRVYNTLLVAGPEGTTHYDKIHTFDAFGYRESDTVKPGGRRVTFEVGGTTVGLATCFDIRFPNHFIALAEAGATVVVVPTSWTDGPGKLDQWRTLTAARALDSTCYLVAAGQARPGTSDRYGQNDGPTGIGHSVIMGPDGARLAETGYVAQVLMVDIDPNQVDRVRKTLPVLHGHGRDSAVG
ncbi:carbon-nitrogen hydrolase family protein [Corynebacterium bovis]|uniref:Amidohydrolase n=1 Tax=Corynebacterium bovis TaxID=36808 RepID=A0A3R8QLN9_9CORY|nr:carbon-nitrogen hydrolase family protein [Corynebacterium bovis]MDN8580285.1 carbon-nitrogen hydrolase family protein [Corynebacterium bovis]RRO83624.1 amidohydrolase [Corynebacterium bovis]RRO86755.1 amidohydrolase [Corynebacterium bovis]RRO90796.1 amidohydrolase [Corynebacterium bovis]RRO95011.1 amidohydrolase [Corynebacterium bovis]